MQLFVIIFSIKNHLDNFFSRIYEISGFEAFFILLRRKRELIVSLHNFHLIFFLWNIDIALNSNRILF